MRKFKQHVPKVPALPVTAPIKIVVENFKDQDPVPHRCVILTGTCQPVPPIGPKIWSICLGESRQVVRQTTAIELSKGGRFSIPFLLSMGRNDITLTPSQDLNDSEKLKISLFYRPSESVPVIHLVALIASDSPHRAINKKKNQGMGISPSWSLTELEHRLRTTAYMCQAFIAEEMKWHKWGPRTFHLNENWNETNKKHIEPVVRMIVADKTIAEIQAAEVERNNGVEPHEDKWVQILHETLPKYKEYSDPETFIIGAVMDAMSPAENNDNIFRNIKSGHFTSDDISYAVLGGIQTLCLPNSFSDLKTLSETADTIGTFVQPDGTSASIHTPAAFSISQLSLLNTICLAFNMGYDIHPVNFSTIRTWIKQFVPRIADYIDINGTFHWHTIDIERLRLSPHITLCPPTLPDLWLTFTPTLRVIYRPTVHPAVNYYFPVLLVESRVRLTSIIIQGGAEQISTSRDLDWKPVYYHQLPFDHSPRSLRKTWDWFLQLPLRVQAANGRFIEVKDAWEIPQWKREGGVDGVDDAVVEPDVVGTVEMKDDGSLVDRVTWRRDLGDVF